MSDELLKQVIERMDVLIKLNIPAFDKNEYKMKGQALDVLKLCDFAHTREAIIKNLKINKKSLDPILSNLRKNGFLISIVKNEEIYYVRLK